MATPAKKAPAKAPVKAPVKPAAAPEPVELPGETVSATLSESKAKEHGLESAPTLTVKYDFGANLDEAVDLFTADVVYNLFKDAAIIALQAKLRRHLTASIVPNKSGETVALPDDPQTLVDDWKPSVSTGGSRKSAGEKVASLLNKLSPDERAALIAKLQGGADEE